MICRRRYTSLPRRGCGGGEVSACAGKTSTSTAHGWWWSRPPLLPVTCLRSRSRRRSRAGARSTSTLRSWQCFGRTGSARRRSSSASAPAKRSQSWCSGARTARGCRRSAARPPSHPRCAPRPRGEPGEGDPGARASPQRRVHPGQLRRHLPVAAPGGGGPVRRPRRQPAT